VALFGVKRDEDLVDVLALRVRGLVARPVLDAPVPVGTGTILEVLHQGVAAAVAEGSPGGADVLGLEC
jgi:hypothetical protein